MADFDSYQKMFGGGTLAAHFTLQDMDADRAKQQAALEAQQASTKATNLANMFNEQNNPIKLQQNQMDLDFAKQTQQPKLDNELAKYAKEAKQHELDQMYFEAQKMMATGAKTGNKEMFDMGQKIYMTHKDFLKIRAQGDQKEEAAATKLAGQKELEAIKQSGRVQLKSIPQAKAPSSGGSGGSLTETKVLAPLLKKALELQQQGDLEGANRYLLHYQQAKQAQAAGRSDPNAGKTTITPEGTFGKIPPKAPVQFNTNKPSLPSGWTMK